MLNAFGFRAKTPEAVQTFLNELSEKLTPLVEKDIESFLALKKTECESRGEEFDGVINMYDYSFYVNKREQQEYDVDHEMIKKYFPLHVVTKGMFKIYQVLCSPSDHDE